MMGNVTDGHLDRLVKARWLAIGVSQSDLAEVLDAAFQQGQGDGNAPNGADADRLLQVADALDFLRSHAVSIEPREPNEFWAQNTSSLQSLLELRLLRAFNELSDHRTKRMLVHLAEQIVKRQTNRRENGG
ncbi:hypothetical protein [Bradyrhizobium sp.]|uniref:hypothetical protein n=1 Tax=Bradyrhizobium sp. TaxID=376 RepID=UPI0025C5705E|nr:hypothetical protein [Bradyrhizobium sp.]